MTRENHDDTLRLLTGGDISALLEGREEEVMQAVHDAYVAHGREQSSLPHSSFLRFPDDESNRIIALPSYLGDRFDLAGIKWIASFPGNVSQGIARASAVMIVNSMATGRPTAVLEASLVSAARTAASAALAARHMVVDGAPETAGLIGTGLINLEVLRFLRAAFPELRRFLVFDLDVERARVFAFKAAERFADIEVEVAASAGAVLSSTPLVSFATTAIRPHLDSLEACPPGATLLHVSLRDLTADAILAADNVVDDLDHVCRARTSIHLAAEQEGHRDFVRCTLADILDGRADGRATADGVTVFSPFGLGVLDLAVADLALAQAGAQGVGLEIAGFLPADAV